MEFDIYKDIATRTGGDIYIGVVGPVRTGKSTFITKFMQEMVLPNMSDKFKREIATDDMPQSAGGKTIMTSQPRFVPAEAVSIKIQDKVSVNVRLIDCVGYLVDGAIGHIENDKPRLVKTPWQEEEMPFEKSAEYGTKKVIEEYSTIGILVTSDGSITEIPRESYVKAEERVIKELQGKNKPFVVILNSTNPNGENAIKIKNSLEEKYKVPVLAVDVLNMKIDDINGVLQKVLYEFPMKRLDVKLPKWMRTLDAENVMIANVLDDIAKISSKITKMSDMDVLKESFSTNEYFETPLLSSVKMGEGTCEYSLTAKGGVFYDVLSMESGEKIDDEYRLLEYVKGFAKSKVKYEKIREALEEVEEKGYGVVSPSMEDMKLEEPELVKQGGRFGVKLKASAPSLHIMKVDVYTELSPIVSSEQQSEDMVKRLLAEFESDPKGLWETNMFGKSLHYLVKEGLTNKLNAMPQETQNKMRKTVSRIINEGKGGVICIIL